VTGSVEEAFVLDAAAECSSRPLGRLEIAPIEPGEVKSAVRVFLDAFHDNVRLVYGNDPKPDAMVDVWSFVRQVEPGGFLAAHIGAQFAGYAIFTSSIRALQRRAVMHGAIFVWALRALSGRYGIRWLSAGKLFWNKLLFVGNSGRFRTEGDAQLINIAVSPDVRGKGVAKALTRAGLNYLAQHRVPEVRLEVRPDNLAAIAAYRANGFVEGGNVRDSAGEWLVMTARP
jgi:ribosomal protein S18 acetylase RimI-like enzyme